MRWDVTFFLAIFFPVRAHLRNCFGTFLTFFLGADSKELFKKKFRAFSPCLSTHEILL